MKTSIAFGTCLLIASAGAFAQADTKAVQRDINQQNRIEQGLQSGQLNTREAARLEREQSRINGLEAKAQRDGSVSAAEAARINKAQNAASRDIAREKTDAQKGNPASASSQRMQADVQRNINQEQRIQQGVKSGSLSTKEASRLERGQARVTAKEARAGADGRVGPREQKAIQRAENRKSAGIYKQKHD